MYNVIFSTESLFELRCPSLKSIKILFLVLNKYSFISWSLSTDWCKNTFTDYLSFVLGSLKFVIKLKPWPAINSRFWRCILKTEIEFLKKYTEFNINSSYIHSYPGVRKNVVYVSLILAISSPDTLEFNAYKSVNV